MSDVSVVGRFHDIIKARARHLESDGCIVIEHECGLHEEIGQARYNPFALAKAQIWTPGFAVWIKEER